MRVQLTLRRCASKQFKSSNETCNDEKDATAIFLSRLNFHLDLRSKIFGPRRRPCGPRGVICRERFLLSCFLTRQLRASKYYRAHSAVVVVIYNFISRLAAREWDANNKNKKMNLVSLNVNCLQKIPYV